jgi:hypothetical protein
MNCLRARHAAQQARRDVRQEARQFADVAITVTFNSRNYDFTPASLSSPVLPQRVRSTAKTGKKPSRGGV